MLNSQGYFPCICTRWESGKVWATVGMQLEAVLQARLVMHESPRHTNSPLSPFWESTVQLVQNLMAWGPGTFLELHWTSWPNLESPGQGRINLTLTLNSLGETETQAREEVLTRYFPFQALLRSHVPEAVFSPIRDQKTLRNRIQPFQPGHCVALVRRKQAISLAIPLGISGTTIGFRQSFEAGSKTSSGTMREAEHLYPWLPAMDNLQRLADFLLWYPEPVWLLVRLQPHSQPEEEEKLLFKAIQHCENLLAGAQRPDEAILINQATTLKEFLLARLAKLGRGMVHLMAFVACRYALDEALVQMAARSFLVPPQLLEGGAATEPVSPKNMLDIHFHSDPRAFSFSEAACLFRFPWPPSEELPGIPLKRWRTAFADLSSGPSRSNDSVILGHNRHRGQVQTIMMAVPDRLRHMFIVGQTGTGKSTFLENLILQDIQAGRGLCLIDPQGELVEAILHQYPWQRQQDLVLIDLTDTDYPFALNLLAWNTATERDFIIDELYNTLHRMYDLMRTGGPVFERHFRGMLRVLLGEGKRDFSPTILELPLLYTDADFRRFCLQSIEDETIRLFVKEAEKTEGEYALKNLATYITSKFSRFSQDQRLRRIFGQECLSLNFSQAMDQGQVLLINLGKGLFGATVSALVASQLVGRFQAAAMARAQISPEKRRDFFLYVDEFHTVAHEAFAELVAEARKYRLGLVLSTQYTEQLQREWVSRGDSMLSAILGNVGATLSFRLGLEDAERLAKAFAPTFSAHDLMELPNWEGYLKLHLGGSNIAPFNIRTIKPESSQPDPDMVAALREQSRRCYCRPLFEVEKKIKER